MRPIRKHNLTFAKIVSSFKNLVLQHGEDWDVGALGLPVPVLATMAYAGASGSAFRPQRFAVVLCLKQKLAQPEDVQVPILL